MGANMIRRVLPWLFAIYFCVAAYGSAQAQTYNLFRPANGILKGATTTYVTTAAAAADVTGIWSGTCNNLTYLRGDGTCATPPGTGGGTVNSVSLTAPSVFAVAGSPVTTSGTLALTFASGQTQNQVLASPNGSSGAIALRALLAADLPAVPLATGVSGTLPVANGGTGAVTLTGPVKGNGTSAFSAAASADIIGLWSGTCSSGTVLKGDGSCGAVGTVTSVGLTVPSGFSVTGSPVTSTGTLAITGTLNPAAGGTGVGTLTGPVKGNGTSAFSAAASTDIIGLWSGLCSATTYLRGDGSCQTPAGGGGTGANPTGVVGLTAVNGSSGNFIRADGAPALDQGIAPTWTATHIFSKLYTSGNTGAAIYASDLPMTEWYETDGGTNNHATWAYTSGGTFNLGFANDARTAVTPFISATRSLNVATAVNITGTAVQANGNPVVTTPSGAGKMAFGKFSGTAGCSFGTNVSGFTACTRNSAGNYSLTVAGSALTNNAACVASVNATVPGGAFYATADGSSSTVLVLTYNSAGTITDTTFQVICMGPP